MRGTRNYEYQYLLIGFSFLMPDAQDSDRQNTAHVKILHKLVYRGNSRLNTVRVRRVHVQYLAVRTAHVKILHKLVQARP